MSEQSVNSNCLKRHLDRLLDSRAFPKTICPSEVARALSQVELESEGATCWRDLMPRIRELAFELRDQEELDVLQKGLVLADLHKLEDVTGPIRLRRKLKNEDLS